MVFGTNTTTHATVVGFFITNPNEYPILNPKIYANVNGKNTTAVSCKPSFVLSGGSIICVLPVSGVSSSLGQFFTGNIYLNVSYCGLASSVSSPSSCATVPKETYKGLYSAHAEPLIAPSYTVSLSVQNLTNLANNAKDKLTATIDLLGYAQSGATINFTAKFTNNGTNAVPPYSLQSKYATSGTNGQAIDYIWGTKASNVTVTASYAGVNASKTINFIPVVPIFFNASNIPSSLQSSPSSIAAIDGVAYSYLQLTKRPTSFAWGCNTTHTYDFEPIIYNSSGTRFVFNSVTIDGITSTGNSGNITVSACKTQSITASYSEQYELYEVASPSAGGSVSPGTSWYAPSSSVTISETPNTTGHYVFANWTCAGTGCYSGTDASTSVTLNNPINETAVFKTTTTTTTTIPGFIPSMGVAFDPNASFGGGEAYVTTPPYDLFIINTADNQAAILLSGTAFAGNAIAFYPSSGAYSYITNPNNRVRVIRTNSIARIGTITGFDNPSGVAFSPSGAYAYVTNYGNSTVSIVSTSTNTITGTIANT